MKVFAYLFRDFHHGIIDAKSFSGPPDSRPDWIPLVSKKDHESVVRMYENMLTTLRTMLVHEDAQRAREAAYTAKLLKLLKKNKIKIEIPETLDEEDN